MAQPTFQAVGGAIGATAAISPGWPSHVAGDVALLFVETANEAVTLSTANGFVEVPTQVGTGTAASTTATRIAVFWCRATSAAMSAPTVANSGNHQIGQILTFRSCISSGNPYDVVNFQVKATASTTDTFSSVTTTVADTLVVLAATRADDSSSTTAFSAWTNAAFTSLTERTEAGTISGNGGGFGIATGGKTTVGATGTTTVTMPSSASAMATIALKGDALNSFSVSNAESPTVTESVGILPSDPNRSVSETITPVESVLFQIPVALTASDTVSATESLNGSQASNAAPSDTVAVSDSLNSYSDLVLTRESSNVNVAYNRSASDTSTVSEAVAAKVDFNPQVSESVATVESVAAQSAGLFIFSDAATVSEAVGLSIASFRSVNDTATATDSPRINLQSQVSRSDTVTTTEATGRSLDSPIAVADSASVSDMLIIALEMGSIADVTTVSESLSHYSDQVDVNERAIVAISPDKDVTRSETATVSDQPNVALVHTLSRSDNVSVSENRDVAIGGGRSIAVVDNRLLDENGDFLLDEDGNYLQSEEPGELIVLTDTPQLLVYTDKFLSLSETPAVSESVSAQTDIPLTVSDSVATGEAVLNDGVPNPARSETVTINEIVLAQVLTTLVTISQFEIVNVADVLAMGGVPNPALSETTLVGEISSVSIEAQNDVGMFDAVALTESVSMGGVPNPAVSDSVSVTEVLSGNIRIGNEIPTFDAVAVTETVAISMPDLPPLATVDTPAVSESVRLMAATLPRTSDSSTVSDTVTLSIESAIAANESATVRENTAAEHHLGLVVTQSVSVIDLPELFTIFLSLLSFEESVSVGEATTVAVVYPDLEIVVTESVAVTTALNLLRRRRVIRWVRNANLQQGDNVAHIGTRPHTIYLRQDS